MEGNTIQTSRYRIDSLSLASWSLGEADAWHIARVPYLRWGNSLGKADRIYRIATTSDPRLEQRLLDPEFGNAMKVVCHARSGWVHSE